MSKRTPPDPNTILANELGNQPWPMTLRWAIDYVQTPEDWFDSLKGWLRVCYSEPESLERYRTGVPGVERVLIGILRAWAHDMRHGYDPDYQPIRVIKPDPEDTPERRFATLDSYPEHYRELVRQDALRAISARSRPETEPS